MYPLDSIPQSKPVIMGVIVLRVVLATLIFTVPQCKCLRVAVVGAGVGGASTAYHLRHESHIDVDV